MQVQRSWTIEYRDDIRRVQLVIALTSCYIRRECCVVEQNAVVGSAILVAGEGDIHVPPWTQRHRPPDLQKYN